MGGDWCNHLGAQRCEVGAPIDLDRHQTSSVQGTYQVSSSKKQGGYCGSRRRSVFSSFERSSRSCQRPVQSGVLLQAVRNCEANRRVQANFGPFSFEQVSSENAVQNGDSQFYQVGYQARRLGSLHRSQRCILPYWHPSVRQEMAEVPLERNILPVQGPSFWSGSVPLRVHESGEVFGPVGKTSRHKVSRLSRRLVDSGSFQRNLSCSFVSGCGKDKTARVCDQREEIQPGSISDFPVSGDCVQHCQLDSDAGRKEIQFSLQQIGLPAGQESGSCKKSVGFVGRHRIHGGSHSSGQSIQEGDSQGVHVAIRPCKRFLEQRNLSGTMVSRGGSVLAENGLETSVFANSKSRSSGGDLCGCFSQRLGCSHSATSGEWIVVSDSTDVAHQCSRVEGSQVGSRGVSGESASRSDQDCVRQHDSGVSDKSSGRNSLSKSFSGSGNHSSLGSEKRVEPSGSSSGRQQEHSGGSAEQTSIGGSDRMDSESGGTSQDLGSVGHSRYRSVCDQVQQEAPSVRVTSSRRSGLGSGCDVDFVGQSESVCLSSVLNVASSSKESQRESCQDDSSRSLVAHQSLVPSGLSHVTQTSVSAQSSTRRPVSASVKHIPSRSSGPGPSRMAFVRQKLHGSGLSKAAIDLNLKGVRPSTAKVYDNHWKRWSIWCNDHGVNPGDPSEIDLANHIAHLADDLNLSAKTLKVRKSAILSTLDAIGKRKVSFSKIASNVIKAAALRQVKTKKPVPKWDVLVVLSYLMSERFEPLKAAHIKQLTYKTCFLILLASGRRASEVCNLSGLSGDIQKERNGAFVLKFLPEFLAKNQTPGSPSPSIRIPPLSDHIDRPAPDLVNCPVRALEIYLYKIRNKRGPLQRALFLSVNPNFKRDIRVTCISRWMRELILAAYLDWAEKGGGDQGQGVLPLRAPVAHEIRAWAASVASTSVPIHEVLEAAFWSSSDVFLDFYLRDIARERNGGMMALPSMVACQKVIHA